VPNAVLLTTYRGFTPGGSVAANIISLTSICNRYLPQKSLHK
jgi:hypothetical protein